MIEIIKTLFVFFMIYQIIKYIKNTPDSILGIIKEFEVWHNQKTYQQGYDYASAKLLQKVMTYEAGKTPFEVCYATKDRPNAFKSGTQDAVEDFVLSKFIPDDR